MIRTNPGDGNDGLENGLGSSREASRESVFPGREMEEFEELFPPEPATVTKRRRIRNFCSLFLVTALLAGSAFLVMNRVRSTLQVGVKVDISRQVMRDMDRNANPCKEFYRYACGGWLDRLSIPADQSQYSRSFSVDDESIREEMRQVLEKELYDDPKSPVGIFYRSCIETAWTKAVDFYQFRHVAEILNAVDDKASGDSIMEVFGKLMKQGIAAGFPVDIEGDFEDPSIYSIYIGQGGFGLPTREYYLSDNDFDVQIRQHYREFMDDLLLEYVKQQKQLSVITIAGVGTPAEIVSAVLEIETALADSSARPEDNRDPQKTNNRVNDELLNRLGMVSRMTAWAGTAEDYKNISFIMDNPSFFEDFAGFLNSVPMEKWKAYTMMAAMRKLASSGHLGYKMKDLAFGFTSALYGTKSQAERWKWCYNEVSRWTGEALGNEFVKRRFDEGERQAANKFVGRIQDTFSVMLDENDWMDRETKESAHRKLTALTWKIGFPDAPDLLDHVNLAPDDFTKNVRLIVEHNQNREFVLLRGRKVDGKLWYMNALDVNAYYDPSKNEMVFPAGILQPPFYSSKYLSAMNFGGIGAVMGHELSHGFDDSGRKYDEVGKLRDWWTESSSREFENKSKCVSDLYSTFRPSEYPENIHGVQTLGENLADIGGVKVAYKAFKNEPEELQPDATTTMLSRKFSADQIFFISYAQTWCSLYRPGYLKALIEGNAHSPGEFRVLGPLSQFQPFADAFNCLKGRPYNPVEKCVVW
uniref:Peptidase M13 N-terminal domain-containing protein n=1 Tax=Compsopogon caeruleus TaxID=31354 RepID=A0A7S1TA37_9RHOD|mmetsp:Transcript_14114/g.28869  ORF Transcript_14114/g.28869 Transcript_14114/m.28869 type:complete len:756 (+) Transcript_14114:126-2393(+)|eukprot:CAMPEP_0184681338 /NCGR_PEP_ID=MMETSP0312-20130426/4301_1 /TAXON_ID=31354 /ORGANISM="Compsopogon coeruleus, Strain SAG 36.94" /LENGTH=755 /DNA_ID=CAMNT_0027132101 /DNA_START=56 /DNA_END=2323 /DNA_ORIENTATION=+